MVLVFMDKIIFLSLFCLAWQTKDKFYIIGAICALGFILLRMFFKI